MRLWMTGSNASDRAIVRAILAAEQHLAENGVTLPECLAAAIAKPARARHRATAAVFAQAEQLGIAALCKIEPTATAGALALVPTPGDQIPPPATMPAKARKSHDTSKKANSSRATP